MTANTTLLRRAYRVLAALDNQWPTRHTGEGLALLCDLRDAIANETGEDPCALQDVNSVPMDMSKFKEMRL